MLCPTQNPQYDIKAIFGQRLKAWRQGRGLPLKRLARDLDLALSGLSQWERGLIFPTAENIALLSAYTKLPPCYFFCPSACQEAQEKISSKLKSSRSPLRLDRRYVASR